MAVNEQLLQSGGDADVPLDEARAEAEAVAEKCLTARCSLASAGTNALLNSREHLSLQIQESTCL